MLTDEERVVLHIIAPRGADFDGRALYSALQGSGFEKRRGDIFYCHGDEGEYMAVNALKPGTFPEEPDELRTRAIGLILRLSAADKPLAAFDEFLSLARYLNGQLDGRLCDSRRSSLTPQTVGYLRDEVQQYHIKHLKVRGNR
jgi:FtsZ-interacting cell division protein ZipA